MLFLFPLSVWAQETEVVFKGIVTNTEGIGIANVLCKALSATDSLLAYGITQSNGQFHLQYKKNVNNLTFSKMGYATQIISVQPQFRNPTKSLRALRPKPPRMRFF